MSPSPSADVPDDATRLLARVEAGDAAAADALLPVVYDELRRRAAAYFREQRDDHTLQPTALVHEAYLKLVRAPGDGWSTRAHFCAVAACAMRQILIDHARRHNAAQRADASRRAERTLMHTPSGGATLDVLDLDAALATLRELDGDQAELVDLRFFGGLTLPEIAAVRGVSVSTIERAWRRTRAWLLRTLRDGAAS